MNGIRKFGNLQKFICAKIGRLKIFKQCFKSYMMHHINLNLNSIFMMGEVQYQPPTVDVKCVYYKHHQNIHLNLPALCNTNTDKTYCSLCVLSVWLRHRVMRTLWPELIPSNYHSFGASFLEMAGLSWVGLGDKLGYTHC